MSRMKSALLRRSITTLAITGLIPVLVWAQDNVGPGSTPEGDLLRGQGQFLKGMGWYELNSAKANAINAKTEMEWRRWNDQLYKDYQSEREAHLQKRARLTKAQQEAARKKYEEREIRLRTSPTSEDIVKGDALNALLVDLSAPSISPSSWRYAKIPLPADLSIPSLAFRFAPKPGVKGAQELSRGVIALARLDTINGNRWGRVLSMNGLSTERKAYDAAYAKVRDECLKGNLSLEAPLGLNRAIAELRVRAGIMVPIENGFRTAAIRAVDDLRDAATLFHADTIDFAQEMIADTQHHNAETVGELLAFMRKYRLMFASAEKTLGGGEMYGRLYALIREQKEMLTGNTGGTGIAGTRLALRKGVVVSCKMKTADAGPNGEMTARQGSYKFSISIESTEVGAFSGKITWEMSGGPVQSMRGTDDGKGNISFENLQNLKGKFVLGARWIGVIDESGNVNGTYKRDKRVGVFSGKIEPKP
jgi:hypothetical protein